MRAAPGILGAAATEAVMAKATRRDGALKRALDLLEKVPMIDGHNDLPWVIRRDPMARGDVLKYGLARRHNDGDTDIPRLRQGRVAGQIWAAYVPTEIDHPARSVLEQIDVILQMLAAHPDVFAPATRAADFAKAKRAGRIASVIAVEGGVGLENSLGPLRVWHAAGARLMTLCHNGTLDWIDSATDAARHGGLTAFGRTVVRELNRLGMIVDCAHVSPDVMRQVLDLSSAPIVFSHSNARGLCDHPRNVPDDVLEKLSRKPDGLVMATFIPDFISEEVRQWMEPVRIALANDPVTNRLEMITAHERTHGPRPQATLAQLADHIEYIAKKVGPERVGVGSDFFGVPTTPVGLEDVSRFPHLLAELFRRGWSDKLVAGIAGRNFIRVFQAVEREGERLRARAKPAVGRTANFEGR
jgi:membrane dipeptidase